MGFHTEKMGDLTKLKKLKLYGNLRLMADQSMHTSAIIYYRITFFTFLSSFVALVLSQYSIIAFFVGHAHEYTKN